MYISEIVRQVEAQKIKVQKSGMVSSKKNPISHNIIISTIKEFSSNLQIILFELIKKENLTEARNDLKIYIRAAVLETPEEFRAAKITEENKNRIGDNLLTITSFM